MQADAIREAVRQTYGAIATGQTAQTGQTGGGCCGSGESCCGPTPSSSRALGYSDEDLGAVPEGADLGLGCGNPQAVAALRPGERVLDLGSGAGFDAFLAARQVGPGGHVVGVDMTAAMVARARGNAVTAGLPNVEFRLGEIEHLPVHDASIDVIMSNCVINLSPDKAAVVAEAFRVLVPGGRLAISDIVALAPLPESLAADVAAYTGCIAGAAVVSDLRRMLSDAGFDDVRIDIKPGSRALVGGWLPGRGAEDYVASASIEAIKPAPACCDSTLLSTCCPAEEKPGCCGDDVTMASPAPATCGCGQSAAGAPPRS
jgi:arsenite methyltransferase